MNIFQLMQSVTLGCCRLRLNSLECSSNDENLVKVHASRRKSAVPLVSMLELLQMDINKSLKKHSKSVSTEEG